MRRADEEVRDVACSALRQVCWKRSTHLVAGLAWCMTLPVASGVLGTALGQRGIDVDGAEDQVEPDAMLHRQDVFGDQVALPSSPNDRHADTRSSRFR